MIWDCFTFFNEFEVLRIRLHELENVVDRFVLVEATRTHRGAGKPPYFADRKSEFEMWADRIVHVVVEDLPVGEGSTAWDRENAQRRAILRGLTNAAPADLVLVSDVDEIPRAAAVTDLVGQAARAPRAFADPESFLRRAVPERWRPRPAIWELHQTLYYFTLDWRAPIPWTRSRATTRRFLADPQALRFMRGRVIPNAGWHFSYLGDAERAATKISAFAHDEYDRPEFTGHHHLERCIALGLDPFGRFDLEEVPIDSSFPEWVRLNLPALHHLTRAGARR
ncbi:MAG TPA: hypothetical protein VMZ51_00615 [Acidimicrobiales bacterium]|nr:hypothetical protein [Acidimicrobiales bacterium]